MDRFDVAIIGGGSAGFAAARTSAERGAKTVLVEAGPRMGGLCILRGCMPSKALLESSHRLHEIRRAGEFGLRAGEASPVPGEIVARKNRLIDEFASFRHEQLSSGRFELKRGRAQFEGANRLTILPLDGDAPVKVEFGSAIIATGSSVAKPPVPGLEELGYLTSDNAIDLVDLPATLTVLGGGAIALELAQHFARLGVAVTVVQRSQHVLSDFDDDVAAVIEKVFRSEGISLITGTRLLRAEPGPTGKRVVFDHRGRETHVDAQEILMAHGRRPAIDSLELDRAGVAVERGRIVVNDRMETSVPHIYAVGDVNGLHEVVHIAIQQGEIAARNATGAREAWDRRLSSTVVFTDPHVAVVGASERALREQRTPYLSASYPFNDHGKSLIHGATEGFVKLLAEPERGELLGGAIVGPSGGELVHEIIAIMFFRGTAAQMAAIPHYHPTLAEILTYPAEELAHRVARSHAQPASGG